MKLFFISLTIIILNSDDKSNETDESGYIDLLNGQDIFIGSDSNQRGKDGKWNLEEFRNFFTSQKFHFNKLQFVHWLKYSYNQLKSFNFLQPIEDFMNDSKIHIQLFASTLTKEEEIKMNKDQLHLQPQYDQDDEISSILDISSTDLNKKALDSIKDVYVKSIMDGIIKHDTQTGLDFSIDGADGFINEFEYKNYLKDHTNQDANEPYLWTQATDAKRQIYDQSVFKENKKLTYEQMQDMLEKFHIEHRPKYKAQSGGWSPEEQRLYKINQRKEKVEKFVDDYYENEL